MMNALDNFTHISLDNHAKKTIFLLHGTGGDEKDLLPLVQNVEHEYNFVGVKGNVSEHGMARFFKRYSLEKFDQENIKEETKKLSEFLTAWYETHHLKAEETVFVGYSNGANMILATLFYYPELIYKAAILHGKLPFEPEKLDLSQKEFLVSYGINDQMIPAVESQKAIKKLKEFGAKVTVVEHEGGHELKRQEVEALHTLCQT